ncbi:hypothetical protein B0H14DRAFT_1184588 [Mycena olivaceomarginata]|nr:hypothetical protein B0H14DRAFT_1184588 [Mycena olivaceomarginata]
MYYDMPQSTRSCRGSHDSMRTLHMRKRQLLTPSSMACCGSLDSRTVNRNAMSCRSRRRVADSSRIASDSRSAKRAASMRWARVHPALSLSSATSERICFKPPPSPDARAACCTAPLLDFRCRRCRLRMRFPVLLQAMSSLSAPGTFAPRTSAQIPRSLRETLFDLVCSSSFTIGSS